jgi:hypothetical protein
MSTLVKASDRELVQANLSALSPGCGSAALALAAVGINLSAGRIEGFDEKVNRLHALMMNYPTLDLPSEHTVTDGLYSRRTSAKAGTILLSETHNKEHQFVMTEGSQTIVSEDGIVTIRAPFCGTTKPGTRRIVIINEDTTMITFHPTKQTDIHLIESEIYTKYRPTAHQIEQAQLDFERLVAELGTTREQVRIESERTGDLIEFPAGEGEAVEVRESPIEGRGLFARSLFDAGESICPAAVGGCRTPAGRFTNHSNEPNAAMDPDAGTGTIRVVAKCRIAAGEEITVDYRQARAAAVEAYKGFNTKT